MAIWYVGSVQHAAIAQYANSHAYSVGDIVRQLAAPAVNNERAFRCTTAGTSGVSEPAWNLTKGSTTNAGTAVFTEVTGNAAYGWAAAAARLQLIFGSFAAAGDTIYEASNHAQTQVNSFTLASVGTSALPVSVISVNPAGSVPPVAADVQAGASHTATGGANLVIQGHCYFKGATFSPSGAGNMQLGTSAVVCTQVYEDCLINLSLVTTGGLDIGGTNRIVWRNTKVQFSAVSQFIRNTGGARFEWYNTPTAIQGSVPTFLLSCGSTGTMHLDGVDLSAAGSGKTICNPETFPCSYELINCKFGASVTIMGTVTARAGSTATVVVSDSAANTYRQSKQDYAGALTPETTYILDDGATDGVTPFSWKVVTTTTPLQAFPFETFPIAVWNDTTGSPVTATVEIESAATLTDADIWLEVEYLGDAAAPLSLLASSGLLTPLTTPANIPASTATWLGSLGSAVKQKLSVTFTPELEGFVRGVVKVAKASQTVYINPELTLT